MRILSSLLFALFVVSWGCEKDILVHNLGANPYIISDVFEQKAASKVDVLWVIDNSESMAAEQQKVADGFIDFINQLVISNVDYHIGVITTNIEENGVLRAYTGPVVKGCDKCRFINREIGCAAGSCDAQTVFQNLINVGIEGSSYEQGFNQMLKAVGAFNIDSFGLPDKKYPLENEEFVRDDASLYVIFVSDEDEGLKKAGGPVKYFSRILNNLKNTPDTHASVSAITGWPTGVAEPKIADIVSLFEKPDVQLSAKQLLSKKRITNILEKRLGCVDENAGNSSFAESYTKAETGTRYINLALMTGGVITNLCNKDYSNDLKLLGADASGLRQNFYLTRASELDYGDDNEPFTDDDLNVDCDNDGAPDSYMCVWAQAINSDGEPVLVPHDATNGFVLDRELGAIRFEGTFLPQPESEITAKYRIKLSR